MGHITIFSLDDCPHCQRTKAAFAERDLPYVEISLSKYPQMRSGMLQLADRLSVPQVFFNAKHIGGADDTLELLEEVWDNDLNYTNGKAKYDAEIAAADEPEDVRLQVPSEPPVETPKAPPRGPPPIQLPSGEMATVYQITEELKNILNPKPLTYRLTTYKNAFIGADAVKALKGTYECSEEDAIYFGQQLQKNKILHHVTEEHPFGATQNFFRLQCHHTPNVLNSYCIWSERIHPDPMALVKDLKKKFSKVETEVTNGDGLVDYRKLRTLEGFSAFEEAACELQGVDWDVMDDNTKRAFGINVYNLMIKYAFAKVGISTASATRGAFFSQTSMNIGGHVLGLNDLEHGVLRANKRPPYTLSVPFSPQDPRVKLAVGEADCRMHFALSCGAKSCPPVKNFTAAAIEEELRIVALAFCEQEENVRVDAESRTLSLSMILYWYRVDFASSNEDLPKAVLPFLRGEKKENLQKLVDDGKKIKVKFLDYDWASNGSDFEPFRPSVLIANKAALS